MKPGKAMDHLLMNLGFGPGSHSWSFIHYNPFVCVQWVRDHWWVKVVSSPETIREFAANETDDMIAFVTAIIRLK